MTHVIVGEQVVKSRDRVRAYGEVFTPRHMVNWMLDLVRDELEAGPGFVDKTFLEPAAGDGNFLVAILRRKLTAIEKWYPRESWVNESLFALASIYGIELLEDNYIDAKKIMLKEFTRFHTSHNLSSDAMSESQRAAAFLIDTNIVCGDTLTGLTCRGEEIQLSWWNRVADATGMVQREPFRFTSLREVSMFDFAVYDTHPTCRIDKVHQQTRIND